MHQVWDEAKLSKAEKISMAKVVIDTEEGVKYTVSIFTQIFEFLGVEVDRDQVKTELLMLDKKVYEINQSNNVIIGVQDVAGMD